VELERDVLMRQHQPHDVDVSAALEAVDDDAGHDLLLVASPVDRRSASNSGEPLPSSTEVRAALGRSSSWECRASAESPTQLSYGKPVAAASGIKPSMPQRGLSGRRALPRLAANGRKPRFRCPRVDWAAKG